MKKTILIVGLVVLALGVLGVGAVFAQGTTPPVGRGGMMGGGYGPMHDYVEEALAAKLGITEKNMKMRLLPARPCTRSRWITASRKRMSPHS